MNPSKQNSINQVFLSAFITVGAIVLCAILVGYSDISLDAGPDGVRIRINRAQPVIDRVNPLPEGSEQSEEG